MRSLVNRPIGSVQCVREGRREQGWLQVEGETGEERGAEGVKIWIYVAETATSLTRPE